MSDSGQVAIKKRLAAMLSRSTAFQSFCGLPDDIPGTLARTHTQEIAQADTRPLAFIGATDLARRPVGTGIVSAGGTVDVDFQRTLAVVTAVGKPVVDPDDGAAVITDANWDIFVNQVEAIIDQLLAGDPAGGIFNLSCEVNRESLRAGAPASIAGKDQDSVTDVQMSVTFSFGD